MDENLSRGYIQLGRSRGQEYRFTNGFSHLSPPVDKWNGVYFALLLAGVGFLLPYNSFTIAVDYFQSRYPDTTIVFDISLVYIIMAFFAVLGNNILVETLDLNTRITFGYLLSFATLIFVAFGELWLELFGPNASYTMTLVAVAIVAVGCTVQQSSFYGFTSMLPSRYTQAVMAGESAAGFMVSLNRIITKSLLEDPRFNTMIFFAHSIFLIATCFGLHQLVKKTEFVQFYVSLCRESRKIVLEPKDDIGLMDPSDEGEISETRTRIQLHSSSGTNSDSSGGHYASLSFANPVYEPQSTSGPSYKVEDILWHMDESRPRSRGRWKGFKRGIVARWEVTKSIWPYALTIALAYFVTLCLYPGIESEITSCKFESWMPVIVMAIFNASDLAGKVLASVSYEWSRTNLLTIAGCRVFLIPFFLLCAMPRGNPYIADEAYPMFFSMVLGLTNGLVGSMPMIQAPNKVSEENRELSGNIMTLSYNLGLTGGSIAAYALHAMLGPRVNDTCSTADTFYVYEVTHSTEDASHIAATLPEASTAASYLTSKTLDIINMTLTSMTDSTTDNYFNISFNDSNFSTFN